jgi:hypothetical protein
VAVRLSCWLCSCLTGCLARWLAGCLADLQPGVLLGNWLAAVLVVRFDVLLGLGHLPAELLRGCLVYLCVASGGGFVLGMLAGWFVLTSLYW